MRRAGEAGLVVSHLQTLIVILVLTERLTERTPRATLLPQTWYYGQLVAKKSNPGLRGISATE